jgi:hypothetical protein
MFWKRKNKEDEIEDEQYNVQTNIHSQATGSERKVWGFPCSPDIPARMKMLADRLHVPLYALTEHALQLSAGLIAKMAEETEGSEQLRQHIQEYHVGRRTIEKIGRLDEEMADVLDHEIRRWLQVETSVRHIILKYIRRGLSPRDIAWSIDYGMRCRIAIARGEPVPKDLPPEE